MLAQLRKGLSEKIAKVEDTLEWFEYSLNKSWSIPFHQQHLLAGTNLMNFKSVIQTPIWRLHADFIGELMALESPTGINILHQQPSPLLQ